MGATSRVADLLVSVFVVAISIRAADAQPQLRNAALQLPLNGYMEIKTWEELDARPLPSWYDEAKFGIFLHWGVFSVPSFGSEWFGSYWRSDWANMNSIYRRFVNDTERANFAYADYAHRFRAELYRPDYWAKVFAASGAQYVVLTSKHHEGFCMWDSRNVSTTWNWNAMEVGPRKDLLGMLAKEVKRAHSPMTGRRLKFGVYHSLYEWYNLLYNADKARNFTTQNFVTMKSIAELYDLVHKYEPELIWSDGEWEAHSDYWNAREFLTWYSTQSAVAATAVWNDRWGTDTLCKHGGFLTCTDRYDPGVLKPEKWEDALTIDKTSWGMNRNSTWEDYLTTTEIVHTLIGVVAHNGNMLLNVGPASDGTLHPIFVDRLQGVGQWLAVNGAGIYATRPWQVCQNDTSHVFYTRTSDTLYAHILEWPVDNMVELSCVQASDTTTVRMLGLDASTRMAWNVAASVLHSSQNEGIEVQLPPLTPATIPCQHAWVLEITGVANLDKRFEALIVS